MASSIYGVIAAAGLALALSAAHAAPDAPDASKSGASDRTKTEASERDEARKKKRPVRADVDSCKRDAHGMHGPERARFMTECLRKRD